ncbi:MAG: PaaX family transcriptional regulator C-terminal domain-containing protein [Candidatus Dormibacteria bacterium]
MSKIDHIQPAPERLGHPAGLILFALGAAEVPPEPPLPGPVLVALLADLGLSEGAARSAILRMRQGGWLRSRRAGRTVAYAPSESTVAGHRRRRGTLAGSGAGWDGAFHALLVSVPERRRAFRDELRRAAHIAGYRTLQPGLLVAATDRGNELGDVLERIPPGASVLPGRLRLGDADTRRTAAELWALEELADRYRSVARRGREMAATAHEEDTTGPGAFRYLAAATLLIYEAVADDPGLPVELLPPTWPAPEMGEALATALRVFGPAVGAYISGLRQAHSQPMGVTAHKNEHSHRANSPVSRLSSSVKGGPPGSRRESGDHP